MIAQQCLIEITWTELVKISILPLVKGWEQITSSSNVISTETRRVFKSSNSSITYSAFCCRWLSFILSACIDTCIMCVSPANLCACIQYYIIHTHNVYIPCLLQVVVLITFTVLILSGLQIETNPLLCHCA